jgi:hypothetical protein
MTTKTDQAHPITPPPELVQQWADMLASRSDEAVFSLAAQWGADQELEACCQWISDDAEALRIYRRPKPPSLKEQALEALRHAPGPDYPNPITLLTADEHALIRRALEQLDD